MTTTMVNTGSSSSSGMYQCYSRKYNTEVTDSFFIGSSTVRPPRSSNNTSTDRDEQSSSIDTLHIFTTHEAWG